jgi:hypothetical protein
MIKAVRSFATVVCMTVLAVGCGSPGSDTTFRPPTGWNSTPGVFGRFQMWITGSAQADRQVVILVRGDQNTRIDDPQMFGTTRGVHDVRHRAVKLCGSQPADSFTGRGESVNGSNRVPESVEGVTTTIGSSKYIALYIHPMAMKPDAQAQTALRSLCPRK